MLKCRQVEARASAYLDNDLGWWQRQQVRLHLLICDACRRYIRQLRLVAAAVVRLELAADHPPAPDFADVLLRRWRETGAHRAGP